MWDRNPGEDAEEEESEAGEGVTRKRSRPFWGLIYRRWEEVPTFLPSLEGPKGWRERWTGIKGEPLGESGSWAFKAERGCGTSVTMPRG